jgi:hypothetical protein
VKGYQTAPLNRFEYPASPLRIALLTFLHEAKMNAALGLCELVNSRMDIPAVSIHVAGVLEAPLIRMLWAWVIFAMSTLLRLTNLRVLVFSSTALKDISATSQSGSLSRQRLLDISSQFSKSTFARNKRSSSHARSGSYGEAPSPSTSMPRVTSSRPTYAPLITAE